VAALGGPRSTDHCADHGAHRRASGPAWASVRAWRYRPLVLDGRAVPVTCDITLRFVLR
jgi:hypothetical protein